MSSRRKNPCELLQRALEIRDVHQHSPTHHPLETTVPERHQTNIRCGQLDCLAKPLVIQIPCGVPHIARGEIQAEYSKPSAGQPFRVGTDTAPGIENESGAGGSETT